jgi:hypothetical protein
LRGLLYGGTSQKGIRKSLLCFSHVAIALADKYREELLASEDEYRILIPDGLTEVLRLDEWHHPDWDCPASQTETFPLIAEVLFTGNSNLYKPPTNPNTDWKLWLPK